MPTKFTVGANNVSDNVESLQWTDFYECLNNPYKTDAHFVAYSLTGSPYGPLPRCNKPVLPKIRLKGADLVLTMLVLDYDTPEHTAWKPGEFSEWLNKLSNVADLWPTAWNWNA